MTCPQVCGQVPEYTSCIPMPLACEPADASASPANSRVGRDSNVPRGNVTSIGALPCGCTHPLRIMKHYAAPSPSMATGDGETSFLRILIESVSLCRTLAYARRPRFQELLSVKHEITYLSYYCSGIGSDRDPVGIPTTDATIRDNII